jgi:hypothetical protein
VAAADARDKIKKGKTSVTKLPLAKQEKTQQAMKYMLGDFRSAWKTLAANTSEPNRGNYLFAHAAGLIARHAWESASIDFTREMHFTNPNYERYLLPLMSYLCDTDQLYSDGLMLVGDGDGLEVCITGAVCPLETQADTYLGVREKSLLFRPNQFFLDVEHAIYAAKIIVK